MVYVSLVIAVTRTPKSPTIGTGGAVGEALAEAEVRGEVDGEAVTLAF
jgi:hypothetical protein